MQGPSFVFTWLLVFIVLVNASYAVDKKTIEGLGLQALDEKAPAFDLVGEDGHRVSLDGLKGKVIILHFWATWCKPCKEEFPGFEKLYQRLREKDAVLIPIAIDKKGTKEEISAFARTLGATFPVYLAQKGDVNERYWTWGVPATYFINRNGIVKARAIGPRDWGNAGVSALVDAMIQDK
ncbi:MAG: TlpA family protein disulfide reductase [Deltaproteobacteria bacterium]|nr:TlpA family protein disulfide reductase [Deltaproteobacteria bacterium]